MLNTNDTLLVVVDVQDRLLGSMPDRSGLVDQIVRLARGCAELGVPILLTEQIPEKLGATETSVAAACGPMKPIEKKTFSCMGEPAFASAVASADRKNVIVCGIETHVCVIQTARDLMTAGYRVEIVADAVASRTEMNRSLALDRACQEGAKRTSVEMVLFELLQVAEGDSFRSILKLVK